MFHRIFEHRMGRRFTRSGDEDGGRRGGRHGFGGRGDHDHGVFDRGGRGGGRFGKGDFRRGRVFDHGELRYVILALIGEQPRHGYEIIKEIEDRLGGAYSPSPGVVYPTLTMLQEIGHAVVTDAGAKKLYAITPEGEAFLAEHRPSVDAIFARMAETGASSNGGRVPQIMRATHNLKLALRLRLSRGSLSEEQVHKITSALDAAATAIERS